MLSNSGSTIPGAPYLFRSSKNRLSYRASRSFVCRLVRVGWCVTIRMSVFCLSIRISVRVGLFTGTSSRKVNSKEIAVLNQIERF